MELRQLRYFLAVAEHRSFRKAAQTLQVSHPSLCAQILNLEKEIGTALFDRTNHNIRLTAPGHTFLEGARRTLESAAQTVETTREASPGQHGELRIGNIGLMCPSLVARLIRAFRERFPEVQVSIRQQNHCEKINVILERLDLGIDYLTAKSIARAGGTLANWVIATAPAGVAAASTAGHRPTATLRNFAHNPFLTLDAAYAPGYLEWTRSIFLQTGLEPAKTIPVDSAEGFFTLLCAGAGVALLSPLHFEGQREGICFQKLTDPAADFPLSLAGDTQRASPLVDNFLAVVRQVLPAPNPSPNGTLSADGLSRSTSTAVNGF
jgi:DNA-binding transcriptional LysR family regulator